VLFIYLQGAQYSPADIADLRRNLIGPNSLAGAELLYKGISFAKLDACGSDLQISLLNSLGINRS
jgi:hypothetical protein